MTKKNNSAKNNKKNKSKNKMLLVAVFLSIGAIVIFKGMPTSEKMPSDSIASSSVEASTANGQALYQTNCASCHGVNGQGGVEGRPMGGMTDDGAFIPPSLDSAGHAWHHPDDVLFTIIKYGSIEPTSPMRGFKDKLNDDEINAIMAHMKSLWSDEIRRRHAKMSN